jgi:hypothetical protein
VGYCPLGLVVPDILSDHNAFMDCLTVKGEGTLSSPVTGLEWPRVFQEVKVPIFLDTGTGWW